MKYEFLLSSPNYTPNQNNRIIDAGGCLWTKGEHRLGLWVRQLIPSQELIYTEPFTAHVYQIQSLLGPRARWPQSMPRLHSLPPPI